MNNLAAAFVLAFACCASGIADEPLIVEEQTCLFLDDHFVDRQEGLTRTFHQGRPHPHAVISETEPWEHWICLWGACFHDPVANVYRMYYQSTLYPSGEPGISFRDYILYAESKDGVAWVKPNLGLVEHEGSKTNLGDQGAAPAPMVRIKRGRCSTLSQAGPQKR